MPSRTSCTDRSLHGLIPCGPQYGSVLNVEMTAEARELTSFKTEPCELTQVAYLHSEHTTHRMYKAALRASPVGLPRHSGGRPARGPAATDCPARAVRGQPDPAVGTDLPVRCELALACLALVDELVKRLMELQDCGLLSTFLAWLLWLLIVHGVPSVSHAPPADSSRPCARRAAHRQPPSSGRWGRATRALR